MIRHVRILVFLAILVAVAIGLLLPTRRGQAPETAQASQIPVLAIN